MSVSKHEEKMINLQTQLRNNQTELQDYLADLDSWEKDIKQKEVHLTTGNSEKKDDLPPVRNTIHKKKLKKKKKEKPVNPNAPKKISGFDFRAWDKFDVDKALEDIDREEKKAGTSSSEYETDEEWEMERKKYLAGVEKDKGNVFLKKGEYDKAVEAYTKGMEFDATNSVLPANRALALLKQQKFAAAELDCTQSVTLDPLYIKAYLRRATARSGMGKLNEAIADFNRVLDLEPANKQAKMELERLNKEMQREKEGPVKSSLTEGQRGVVKPIYKSPEERSKAPLQRIVIEEIGLESNSRPINLQQSEVAKKITAKEGEEFDKLFKSSTPSLQHHSKINELVPSSENHLENHQSVVTKDDSYDAALMRKQPAKLDKSDSDQLKEVASDTQRTGRESLQNKPDISNSPRPVESKKIDNNQAKAIPTQSDIPSCAINGDSGSGFAVPQTSFQFQADFKILKKRPDAFFKYIQAIPPNQYSKLFGQSLDADILNAFLKVLASFSNGENIDLYEVLNSLSNVKRFSMTAMFLSQKDKQVASSLIQQVASRGKHPESDISSLRKKYDL